MLMDRRVRPHGQPPREEHTHGKASKNARFQGEHARLSTVASETQRIELNLTLDTDTPPRIDLGPLTFQWIQNITTKDWLRLFRTPLSTAKCKASKREFGFESTKLNLI